MQYLYFGHLVQVGSITFEISSKYNIQSGPLWCIEASSGLDTKMFKKVDFRYKMALVLPILILVCILCSSDSWAGLTKLSSSGRTVSGIVACGLHCHSDRDCSAFSFVQDGKTCQMAKLVMFL